MAESLSWPSKGDAPMTEEAPLTDDALREIDAHTAAWIGHDWDAYFEFVRRARADIPRLITEVRRGREDADGLADALGWLLTLKDDPEARLYDGGTTWVGARQRLAEYRSSAARRALGGGDK